VLDVVPTTIGQGLNEFCFLADSLNFSGPTLGKWNPSTRFCDHSSPEELT